MATEGIQGIKENEIPKSLTELEAEQQKSPETLALEAAQKVAADKVAADAAAVEKTKTDAAAAAAATQTAEDAKKTEDAKLQAAQEVADKRYADLKAKDPATLTEVEKKELTELTPDESEDENPDEFWGRVNQLHGFEADAIKVDYKGLDPLSPEGVVVREKAIMEFAQKGMDEYLRQSDPRAYAYFLHRRAGGDEESFFATPSITLPEYETFKNNVDLQKQVLTRDLQSRGIDEAIVKNIVEQTIKENKLFEVSDKSYKKIETAESKALEVATNAAAEREAAEEKVKGQMGSFVDDIITNSKTENIVIPDARKAEFAKDFKDNLFFDGTNFFVIKPLTKENAAAVIQTEYFGHVKGNLKELVERSAGTKVAAGLRLKARKTEKSATSSAGDNGRNSNVVPFADL
jgi:hypothetical protein